MRYSRKYDLSSIVNIKKAKIKPPKAWYTLVATWFFIGLFPFASGTLGSLGVYPVYWWIINNASTINQVKDFFWIAALITTVIGTIAVEKYEKAINTRDHSSVVIDEVLGMLICMAIGYKEAFALSKTFSFLEFSTLTKAFFICFIAFRFFDITKILFIRLIDKNMKNSIGVMLDDALAGLYAGFTIIIASNLSQFIGKYV